MEEAMRKLKLQMQMTVDGFVGGPSDSLDWMTWEWDDELKKYVNDLTDSVDTILMGRKMTDGFIEYWSNVKPESEEYPFARKMVEKPKIVFTRTLNKSEWENTTLAKGEIENEVNKVKNREGKDIIVYGGAGFVSSLVRADLIDEYYLFVNPALLGDGRTIFRGVEKKMDMILADSRNFDCGIVLNKYVPKTKA
jgi:dihydrofolate reductase